MSSVRMCDRDGSIFSENEDGWSTGTATKMVRDPVTGQTKQVTITQDLCADCTELASAPIRPQALNSRAHYDRDTIPGTVE